MAAALVITSISGPTPGLRLLAEGAIQHDFDFILIGDEPSPAAFSLDGCRFYGLAEQRDLALRYATLCPTRHYARKNIGYLIAIHDGSSVIVETDDDSVAADEFWAPRTERWDVKTLEEPGWVNVYRYFSNGIIWPRGLPLDEVHRPLPSLESLPTREVVCPIQQALVDDDPDVDAIYRLVLSLPFRFESGPPLALATGAWCPFNSQNTTWLPDAFPLLYLPAFCSFRMTDIWRSFVAQRIAWLNDWAILFQAATVRQLRNAHDLMQDFRDEVPGYLHNREIAKALDELPLKPGREYIAENMRIAYERLVAADWLPPAELELLDAWLDDIAQLADC